MKSAVITLLICIIFVSCKKDSKEPICGCVLPYHIYYLKAKVVHTSDISCYLPVLDFSEDSLRIRNQTKLNNLTFIVKNLPANLIVQDQKIYVSVESLLAGEQPVCNTLGIPLPPLKVVDAKTSF